MQESLGVVVLSFLLELNIFPFWGEDEIILILRKIVASCKSIKWFLFRSSYVCRVVNCKGSRWTVSVLKPLCLSSTPVLCTLLSDARVGLSTCISPWPHGFLLGSAGGERLESRGREEGLHSFLTACSSLFPCWPQWPFYRVVSHRILVLWAFSLENWQMWFCLSAYNEAHVITLPLGLRNFRIIELSLLLPDSLQAFWIWKLKSLFFLFLTEKSFGRWFRWRRRLFSVSFFK